MTTTQKISYITLALLISFASVNAVLFTPALPNIAKAFAISSDVAQLTVTLFLIGYTFGQLLYGPVASRFSHKRAIYVGVGLQIVSSLICALSGYFESFKMLAIGRLLLAIGSGVGLKMSFTIISETYESSVASKKISYLTPAFTIMPSIAMVLSGYLNQHYGWESCFYLSAAYGFLVLWLSSKLPETQKNVDYDAFKLSHLLSAYGSQFKNKRLLGGGMLMGACTAFVYVFAAFAPFIAINLLGMTSSQYGAANILPPIGLIIGSLISARIANLLSLRTIIMTGISLAIVGTVYMAVAILLHASALHSLFLPMMVVYAGLSFVIANASAFAMTHAEDKAHGSAVMNFLNMGVATVMVLSLKFVSDHAIMLPIVYAVVALGMIVLYRWAFVEKPQTAEQALPLQS